jgi:transposase
MSHDLFSLVTALLPGLAAVRLAHLTVADEQLLLDLTATAATASCPLCTTPSATIHSRYQRHLSDVPWGTLSVRLRLRVRKFVCRNPDCVRRIFTERLPDLVESYARKTTRLVPALRSIGLALGGQAGARLARRLHYPTSPATLRRLVRRAALPAVPPPDAVGIDEWAWRRGHQYGTILVNLTDHRVIDLLPDRSADSVARWLAQRPTITLVCRDRSDLYADGIRRGAPDALQVVDRFHLVQNLREALESVLVKERPALQQAAERTAHLLAPAAGPVVATPMYRGRRNSPQNWQQRLAAESQRRNAPRVAAYQAVHALHEQGTPVATIARVVGVSRQTVYTYLRLHQPPDPKRPQFRQTNQVLTPYVPYLLRRWREGCRDSAQLWHEIQALGYTHSARTVSRFVTQLRRAAEAGRPPEQHLSPFTRPQGPSPRAVSFVIVRPAAKRTSEEQTYLEQLWNLDTPLAQTNELTQRFLTILRERQGHELDAWIADVLQSGIDDLARFARGLQDDHAAVKAGLTLEWSNGVTEGHNHRLKLIKRQAYGRAGFDFLRQRVLQVA